MSVNKKTRLFGMAIGGLVLSAWLGIPVQQARAQVTVTLNVRNPMPSQLSTWQNDPTLIQMIVTNAGSTSYHNLRASFVVEDLANNGATVLQSKDSDPSMPRFDLASNSTITKFGTDIVNVNAINFSSSYEKNALNTNSIPEGQYQFCVTIIDQNNTSISSVGKVCMPFVVFIPDPPTLNTPTDQSNISDIGSTPFGWTPVMIGTSQATYQLTISPIFQNQTPHDAIQSNNPLLQKTLQINTYVYSPSDPPFSFYPAAIGFAWQVQALDAQNLPVAKNDGKSQIFSFTLQGKGGASQPLTLEQYYPFDNDTIPWIPPHIIVMFNPYSDSITKMDYTLNVTGSDNSSYSASRTLLWPQGPRKSQGWTDLADTDRARYIITDLQFTGNSSTVVLPSWAPGMKRGVKYSWSVNATFTKGNSTITANTGTRTFVLGATSPILTSPADKSVIDSASQPVTLSWQNQRPDSLNPQYFVGMGSSMQKSAFKGAASELWKLEMSHDSTFAIVDTVDTLRVPSPTDSTGGVAPGLYQSRSLILKPLPRGKYFWRASWLDNATAYLKSDVWSFTIGVDTSQQKKKGPPDTNQCGGNYMATVPSDQSPTANTFSTGQVIRVGLFTMTLTKVTSSAGTNLTGEGTISVPYLHAPIEVEFNGLKVNKNSEVVGGSVTAKVDPSSPISSTVANQLGALGLKNSDITSVMNIAGQASRLVSALTSSTPVPLPIGLDNSNDGFPITIGIIGMMFTDTIATLNAVASFPLPDLGPNIGLGVGARDIPLQPGGLGFSQGTLYLAEDIGYDQTGSFGFRFKAPTKSDSGTYMMWDCKGFKELRLRADIHFPREWLIPVPDTGGQVAAKLATTIRKAGDWIASASLDSCEIAGASGMKLSVADMVYDHSDIQNPQGIVFPANYPKGKPGNDWHGFFIRSASITFPKELQTFKGSPPSINVSNMIIDGAGFTAAIYAANVIQYPEGNFGQWGASIDTIGLKFACSSLTDGLLSGRIQIPIADSSLVYSAVLSTLQSGKMKFVFNIHPTSEVKASVWCATLGLDPSSSIVVADSAGKFWATAVLNGNFSINGKAGDLPNIDLQLLQFQNVMLTTNSPYIQTGTWKFGSPQHSMSGFPISISDVGIATGQRKNGFGVGIKFSVSANLADVVSGSTSLSVWGVLNLNSTSGQKFAFDGVDVDTIKVKADLGAVLINGSIVLYHDDPTFGNGFRGALDATFIKTVEVSAVAQFGSVNDYRYWYVDASAVFNAGISFGPVAMYGLGGGAWYHMKPGTLPSTIDTTNKADKVGSSLSGMTFTPDQSSDFGFQAKAQVGVSGRPNTFLCSITLGVNFVNGGIGSIFLNGDGYILASETAVADIISKKDATVLANVQISYDFVNSVFEGNFKFWTGSSYSGVFAASGDMNIHFDPNNWHVLIGVPNNRIKLTLLSFAKVDAYIMAGTDIPAPDLNNFEHIDDIRKAIAPAQIPVASRPLSGGNAAGFALGASFSFSGDFTFLIFYAHMDFGMGFDIAVIQSATAICKNTNQPPGVNGWFGYGDLYFYADFDMGMQVDMGFVHGKFSILSMGAGALAEFQAPNPIWVQGIVGGHFSILGGMVEGHASFTFEIGQKCDVEVENPLKIDLFVGATPSEGAQNVDVFAAPSITTRLPIDQRVDLTTPDENGNPQQKSYKIEFHSYTLTDMSSNNTISGHPKISTDGCTNYFITDEPLPEQRPLRLSAEVWGYEWDGSNWNRTVDLNNHPIVQDTILDFTSGKRPDSLTAETISWSLPLDRQRYFLYGENNQGYIYLNTNDQYLFNVPGTYIVRYMPIAGGNSQDVSATYDGGSKTISFPLSGLQPSTEYALQLIRKEPEGQIALSSMQMAALPKSQGLGSRIAMRSPSLGLGNKISLGSSSGSTGRTGIDSLTVGTPKFVPAGLTVRAHEKLLHVLYFQTSKHSTLAEKINQLNFSGTADNKYLGIYENFVATFGSDEGWDAYDMNGFTKHAVSGTNTDGDQPGDPLILVDAVHTTQSWFNSFAGPKIYTHITDLFWHGLWDINSAPIADERYWAARPWVHPAPQATYASPATGEISVPYTSTSPPAHTLGQSMSMTSLGMIGSSSAVYTLKVNYLHGSSIASDFSSLCGTAFRLVCEYNAGYGDDEGTEIYRTGDWVPNNLGWLNALSSALWNPGPSYTPMYQDNYTIDFSYSPKSGPWISKNFTYGHPNMMQAPAPVKSSTKSGRGGRVIRH